WWDRQVLTDGVEAAVVGVLRQRAGDKGTGMFGRRDDTVVEVDRSVRFGNVGRSSDQRIALVDREIPEGVHLLPDIQPALPKRAGVRMAVECVLGECALDPGRDLLPLGWSRLRLVGRRHLPGFDPVPDQLPDLRTGFFPQRLQVQVTLWLLRAVTADTI